MMQSKALTFCFLFVPFLLVGCDGNLTDMNKNPTEATSMEPELQFADLPLSISDGRHEAWRSNLIHAECISQHLAGTILAWSGCRYTRNEGYMTAYWRTKWGVLKNIEDVLSKTDPEENPELTNLNAMTRILRVFVLHRMTDLYGEIPYEEGGKGLTDDIQKPSYDPQDEIYSSMISDLQEARDQLDPSQNMQNPGRDLLFEGDMEKWQRFASSMILRLGMRMSEVDPSAAEAAVTDAINSGVMQSNDDMVFIMHSLDNVRNGVGHVFNDFGIAGHGFRMSKTFMDILLDADNGGANVDPRVNIFSAQYNGDGELVSEDPADLQGMENGLTAEEIPDDTYQFAQPHRDYMVRYNSPDLWMSYAEVKFLLAEAALRGWGASNARQHYEEGIEAAMKHLTIYGAPEISDQAIQDYIDNLPAGTPSLEEVIEQKWIALFLNGYESWAELRRTGYPEEIEPVDYPGNVTGGTLPRRVEYPATEEQFNEENFQEVLDRQGPDEMTTRLWWDTEGQATP